jgi:DNA segregation ATPase FtsK/SpoIIIE, S-DNA-T family
MVKLRYRKDFTSVKVVDMLLEFLLFPVFIGGVVLYRAQSGWTDQKKIEKVLELLEIKEGKQTRKFTLLRKTNIENGMEYVYKIPLKSSMDKIESIYPSIRDGINIKREGNQKHVEIEYDGALKIRVYEKEWGSKVDFPIETLEQIKGWSVPIGASRDGKTLWHDFDKYYHALIGGTSGYGKTELIRLVCHVLMIVQPNHVKLTIIDLKGGLEFMNLSQYKQVKKVCKDEFEAEKALKDEVKLMKEIQTELLQKGVRNVKQAGIKERHFVIVDEAAELSIQGMKGKSDAKNARINCDYFLSQLARIGRSTGHRVIYCTQYPLRETINPQIKNNLDTRIAMKLKSSKASEVVLDETGAQDLPKGIPGRALYKIDKMEEIQTYYLDEKLALELLEPYKVVEQIEVNNGDRQGENRKDIIEFR